MCADSAKMGHIAKNSIIEAMEVLFHYDTEKAEHVRRLEGEVDLYEDRLGTYLVKLSAYDLSDADNKQVSKMLHTIGDFERISDHAVNIMEAAKELDEKNMDLSKGGRHELKIATRAIQEIMELAISAFEKDELEIAYQIEPLEEVMDNLVEEIKRNHINRLQSGECTIQQGFVFSDILTNYERVSDHCSNIGVSVIELASDDDFDAHEYLDKLKTMEDESFKEMFRAYRKKYAL